jgi:YfiH family protein
VGFNSLPGWTWIGCYGGYYLQADLLTDFEHGFFTRQWNGRGPEVLAGYLSAGVSVHRPKQIHSNRVLAAHQALGEPWPEADGLVSDEGGQSLWVCGADCTPVLIADPCSGRVAACHTGWRGVAGQILERAIGLLENAGSRRGDLLAALGPAISGQAYQVERSVSELVAEALTPNASRANPASTDETSPGTPSSAGAIQNLQACGALVTDAKPGHDRLDIRLATQRQLENLGLPKAQIAACPLCTASEPLLFHSWRRDQVKAVQWSGIVSQA